jgi:hypothetical protein
MDAYNKWKNIQAKEDREKACRKEKKKDVEISTHKETRIWGKRKIKIDKTSDSRNPVERSRRIISPLHPSKAAFNNV